MMDYKILPRGQWDKVLPIFQRNGVRLPEVGIISSAMDGDKVCGFMCLQPILHSEPLWIDPVYRAQVNFRSLHRTLSNHLPAGTEYFAFAPNEQISRMAEICGLQEEKCRVWKGVF